MLFISALVIFSVGCVTNTAIPQGALIIQEQGSFAVGGTVISREGTFDPIAQGAWNPMRTDETGQTLHGDHAFVFYQVPVNSRELPLVFWHGFGQFSKTWQTTPDGREGFQNIFLRRGFPVYLVDQPRRASAGRSTADVSFQAVADEQLWFGIFRMGTWPNFYQGVAFPNDPESLNQFFRQAVPSAMTPANVNTTAISALFDRIGSGILVTHSGSGSLGWTTAMMNSNIKAIVSFEPAVFPFPEGEAPVPISMYTGMTMPLPTVPMTEFEKLLNIPIIIYFGDNIPEEPSVNPGQDQWRVALQTARIWRDVMNSKGGDVTLVHLPEIGIHGNTHFPFADLNNLQIADHLSSFLREKNLD
jgi:hypothetical protein